MKMMFLVAALSAPILVRAQACTPPEHPLFEFQVQRPAKFIGDTAARPRPSLASRPVAVQQADPNTLVLSFIVDSLGVVQAGSVHLLKPASKEASEAVGAVMASWKFAPAMLNGCRVPQVVMTEVEK